MVCLYFTDQLRCCQFITAHNRIKSLQTTHLYIFALFNTPITTIWRYGILKLYTFSISSVLLVSEQCQFYLRVEPLQSVENTYKTSNSRFRGVFNVLLWYHWYIKPALLLLILKLEALNLLTMCITLKFRNAKWLLCLFCCAL